MRASGISQSSATIANVSIDVHQAVVEPIRIGARGPRFRVTHAGMHLVESDQPALDACRVLLAAGVTGTLELWHKGACHAAMRIDIEIGAGLTIVENATTGPKIGRYQRFDEASISSVAVGQGAVSG